MRARKPKWKSVPGIRAITKIGKELGGVVLSLEYEVHDRVPFLCVRTTEGIFMYDVRDERWEKYDPELDAFKPLESK